MCEAEARESHARWESGIDLFKLRCTYTCQNTDLFTAWERFGLPLWQAQQWRGEWLLRANKLRVPGFSISAVVLAAMLVVGDQGLTSADLRARVKLAARRGEIRNKPYYHHLTTQKRGTRQRPAGKWPWLAPVAQRKRRRKRRES